MNDTTFQARCERVGERGLNIYLYDDLLDSRNEALLKLLEKHTDHELRSMVEFPIRAFARGRYGR